MYNTRTRMYMDELKNITGEGNIGRVICDRKVSLTNPTYWKECDEADGVYFRTITSKCIENHIILVFNVKLLNHSEWNVNTTENNGFFLGKPGVVGRSPLTGILGITYDNTNIHQYRYSSPKHELLVVNNVSLSYLDAIIVKNKEQEKKIMDSIPKKLIGSIPIYVQPW